MKMWKVSFRIKQVKQKTNFKRPNNTSVLRPDRRMRRFKTLKMMLKRNMMKSKTKLKRPIKRENNTWMRKGKKLNKLLKNRLNRWKTKQEIKWKKEGAMLWKEKNKEKLSYNLLRTTSRKLSFTLKILLPEKIKCTKANPKIIFKEETDMRLNKHKLKLKMCKWKEPFKTMLSTPHLYDDTDYT